MSDMLADGLVSEPTADTHPTTPEAALDAVYDAPAEAPATSDPSDLSSPTLEPAAAIVQPSSLIEPKSGDTGAPPPERWERILDNARTKAREDTLAAHKDQLEIIQRLRDDFPGTLAQLLEEGSIDPRFSEQITSRAAAILAARNKAAKAEIEPEADLQTADGALVYSADQLRKWQQWNGTQTERKLTEQFKPLQQLQQRFEQHQQQMQMAQEAQSVAEERGSTWKSMPFFADHKAAILSRQAELYAEAQAAAQRGERRFDPVNTPWEALQRAYSEVVSTQAVPKLQSQQTQDLVAHAARKRAGSSSDPAVIGPAHPRKPRTVDEALDQVFNAVTL